MAGHSWLRLALGDPVCYHHEIRSRGTAGSWSKQLAASEVFAGRGWNGSRTDKQNLGSGPSELYLDGRHAGGFDLSGNILDSINVGFCLTLTAMRTVLAG